MAKQIARYDINDTLYIFKQDNSERWYARFILTNHKKWLCKSTKKKDRDEAIAMAHRIFLEHEIRHENNTLVQSKRFRPFKMSSHKVKFPFWMPSLYYCYGLGWEV